MIRCKEEGLTNRETAKFVPYSQGWVGTRWREYRDEGLHEETLSRVEEVIAGVPEGTPGVTMTRASRREESIYSA